MKKLLLSVLLFIQFCFVSAQEIKYINKSEINNSLANAKIYSFNDSLSYYFVKPKPFSYIKHSLQDLYLTPKVIFKKESIVPVVGVTASTLLLIAYDEKITQAVQQFSRYINLSPENNAKNISPVDGMPFFVPTDLSSGLYYIGDGITEIAVNSGFYIYSLFTKDPRARQTASQLSEGMIATGIYVQIFKHLTGRTTARASGGKDIWRPFPSWKEYYSSVPKYDAFYSGHLTTAMMTTTVIAMNYPEKKFVKPLGYTLIGLCGFQMINNGVHWAGDYPMAIAMGYVIAKIAVNRGRYQIIDDTKEKLIENSGIVRPEYKFKPSYLGYGASGFRFTVNF
jgi:hypothetical protein